MKEIYLLVPNIDVHLILDNLLHSLDGIFDVVSLVETHFEYFFLLVAELSGWEHCWQGLNFLREVRLNSLDLIGMSRLRISNHASTWHVVRDRRDTPLDWGYLEMYCRSLPTHLEVLGPESWLWLLEGASLSLEAISCTESRFHGLKALHGVLALLVHKVLPLFLSFILFELPLLFLYFSLGWSSVVVMSVTIVSSVANFSVWCPDLLSLVLELSIGLESSLFCLLIDLSHLFFEVHVRSFS